jgi:hypothetical protein
MVSLSRIRERGRSCRIWCDVSTAVYALNVILPSAEGEAVRVGMKEVVGLRGVEEVGCVKEAGAVAAC